jgi:hypothetical protein
MMLSDANLDAFLQLGNGLQRTVKKDDHLLAILLTFINFKPQGATRPLLIRIIASPGAHIDQSKFRAGIFGLNGHHALVVFRSHF